jgi:hypothetical protein
VMISEPSQSRAPTPIGFSWGVSFFNQYCL